MSLLIEAPIVDMRILQYGSKARDKRYARNYGLQDAHVYAGFWAPRGSLPPLILQMLLCLHRDQNAVEVVCRKERQLLQPLSMHVEKFQRKRKEKRE